MPSSANKGLQRALRELSQGQQVTITESAFDGNSKQLVGKTGELVFIDPKNGFGLVNVKLDNARPQVRAHLWGLKPVERG